MSHNDYMFQCALNVCVCEYDCVKNVYIMCVGHCVCVCVCVCANNATLH